MAKSNKCRRGQHRDKWLRGHKRVKCENCGDEFPCGHPCQHLDCDLARQDTSNIHPEWNIKLG